MFTDKNGAKSSSPAWAGGEAVHGRKAAGNEVTKPAGTAGAVKAVTNCG